MSDKDKEFAQSHYEDGVLYNLEAVRLWLQGKDTWNKWVEENPECDVDFSAVDFGYLRKQCNKDDISFISFKFPKGNVDFSAAQFGEGNVNFIEAQFGEGDVSFEEAQFGEGNVSFQEAKFGKGNMSFYKAHFGEGTVSFSWAQFGEGNVNFVGAQFGEGNVNFSWAQFGEGNVSFYKAHFGKGNVNFELIKSKGNLILKKLKEPKEITSVTMMGASIDGLLSLSSNAFNCVPDLSETNIKHDVELQTLNVQLKREKLSWKGLWAKKAKDSGDIERLRKLKQIAENNKHHEAALKFHADEMKAKRWRKKEDGGLGALGSTLDFLFSFICNYGQSIKMPVIILLITWFIFFFIYSSLTKEVFTYKNIPDLFVFTATNSIPFIPVAKKVREVAYSGLLDESTLLFSIMSIQALISLVLVFLIGLGVRNRFRI